MIHWVESLSPREQGLVRDQEQLTFPPPQLATLSDPSEVRGTRMYERKWDGMRILARVDFDEVTLWSRSGRNVTSTFPRLTETLASLERLALLDGEVVALDEQGRCRFHRLQQRMHQQRPSPMLVERFPVQLVLFDVLNLDGIDTTLLPNERRQALLWSELASGPRVLRTEAIQPLAGPAEMLEAACNLGWEGLIAKDPKAPYRGGRQQAWLKLKCLQEDTFVVVGYRLLQGSRSQVGSLVLAEPTASGPLVLRGSVGTGLTDRGRREALEVLSRHRRADPPVAAAEPSTDVHWVDPVRACQVAYAERSPAGSLRHPRFLGWTEPSTGVEQR